MAFSIDLFSEFDKLTITCQHDDPVIWIRTARYDSVSLSLSKADRDAMRKALDAADAIDNGDQQ